MKKRIRVLLMTFLLTVSSVLPVCAVEVVESVPYAATADMTYNCQFNTARSVTAGTAMDGQIVVITSKSYDANGNSNGSGENTAKNYATTTYSTFSDILYVVNTHSVPKLGLSVTRKVYR